MHHLYLSYQPSETSLRKEREALEGWCRESGIEDYEILEEDLTAGRILQSQLTKLLKPVLPGDTVVATSLSRLGRSINMLISILKILSEKGVTVITLDDGRHYLPNKSTIDFITNLETTAGIIKKIKAERSTEALDRAKADGKQFGRPLGKKKDPAKNVLAGKTEQLVRLHNEGLSPQKIADELGVSRGTIVNYIKDNGLKDLTRG